MEQRRITYQEAPALLKELFKTDSELIEKWHIEAGNGIDRCAERTSRDLKEANVQVFKLEKDGRLVGYYGKEQDNWLTGFFIKPEFRNKETVNEFWEVLDSEFSKPYFTGVYTKNARAIQFLLKKGQVAFEVENGIVIKLN